MLHNIFRKTSKNKTKKQLKPKIIVDIHEKNSLVPSYLKELKVDIDFKDLKVGDYAINKIIIERKTINDFVGSMINKRLVQQLKHLQQAKQAIVLIEGNPEFQDLEKFNSNSIRGFILSILLNHQIPIIFTQDSEDTAKYLHILAKQQITKPQEISLHSRIPKTKKEQKKYILESFPNIGPKTATKLLKHFKTISNIINADEQELKNLIGKKADSLILLRNSKF